jgi:hypothetical protein
VFIDCDGAGPGSSIWGPSWTPKVDLILSGLMPSIGSVVRVRWLIAVFVVLALLVTWVVFAELHRGPATRCAPGTVRVRGACIQT